MAEAKATDDEFLAAIREGLSHKQIADRFGLNIRNVQRRRKLMASRGLAPEHDMTKTVPDGYKVRGVSTLYDQDGQVRAQWVKSTEDRERRAELLREAAEALGEDLPRADRIAAPRGCRPDLLVGYPIGDPHIGMRAWAEECGEDWDLAIAERVHCEAMSALVEASPAAEKALIVNLGDLLHYDSMAPVTPRSGHLLDADGRYAKVVRVAIKVLRACITEALRKHKKVHVINAPGNHDETGALWLSVALANIYENNPRVQIDQHPGLFTYHRFGKCLVGVHHGHTCKADKLPAVMATDRAQDWGATEHRYWWTGHVHHESVREFPGVSVETFNTLASRDAYATAGGWRSRSGMQAIFLHEEHGELGRTRVNARMFR